LDLRPGETFALVGPSGGGKSTVGALLERFYDPQAGAVLVDGEDVRTLDLAWLRRNVGTVSQDPTLFDGTVAENVAYAVGGPHRTTNDSIATAAEIANARGFIEAFPDGYDTRVGENGALLSGGQKQRLAIARVVLADPAILLLDEATSALDAESEAAVSEALTKVAAGRTVILVAHRLSTVRRADRVGVLKDGRLVECGTHEQLMAKKDGAYRALVQTQLQA
jgi:ABC-type multidrug transport system fused ATPase/permease subunit